MKLWIIRPTKKQHFLRPKGTKKGAGQDNNESEKRILPKKKR